jgi:hypothetical protein
MIDPSPNFSYNTFMTASCNYFAGFFRPDHDPPPFSRARTLSSL